MHVYVYIYVYISLYRYIYTYTLISYDYLQKYFKHITKRNTYVCIYTKARIRIKARLENYIVKLSSQTLIVFQSHMIQMPSCNSSEIHTGIFVLNDFNSTQR